jgi:transketolase
MSEIRMTRAETCYETAEKSFEYWEITKDLIDEMIDLTLNYRQSGHPGGSRSKVHAFLATLLSGAMRWDVLRPWRPYCDRFVLSAGHTVPLIYTTLAVLNEAMRLRHGQDGDERFAFPADGKYALTWEDLMVFRRNKGLSGHAEMEGKTLFLKFNTGPSGHGIPAAAGEALALKMAGAEQVKVFAIEGEGGLTPGASHETKNSAWGLGLSNLVFLVDWNNFGIDDTPIDQVVHGTPDDWFKPYGWKVSGNENGSEWADVTRSVLEAARGENPDNVPCISWHKTRKGRGYGVYDNKSHGAAHKTNSELFWKNRKEFMAKYGVQYEGVDQGAPTEPDELKAQTEANFRIAMSVMAGSPGLVTYLSDRLAELAGEVPDSIPGMNLGGEGAGLFQDKAVLDYENYPDTLFVKPGEKAPNRAAFAKWGAWVNTYARENYDRPLVVGCSADLADSTNLSGLAKDWDGKEGWGWYHKNDNHRGTVLPQQITEFSNAGIMAGMATVNLADDPMESFNGFWGACSTYGSFSYLKYGAFRLLSQLGQDSDLKIGKVIWIAGHSGPETAEDSRTHFGIYATGVTQMFPEGHCIDLHPWEHNEVPVMLAAALQQDRPLIALHLTRPAITIPDREALGIASHFEAARGAYVLRPYREDQPKMGTVFVQGTMSTANLVEILPELDKAGLNVKVVAALSPQLLALQNEEYRNSVFSTADRWDAMMITNRSLRVSSDWVTHPVVAEYSMAADWDGRWRTGGSLDEIIAEAHLDPESILSGIERFVRDRSKRLGTIRSALEAAEKH